MTTPARPSGALPPPTPAGQRVLDAIRHHVARHGTSPGIRDLADALSASLSTVHWHLGQLEAAGWIVRERNRARSTRLVDTEACPTCGASRAVAG